MRMSNQSMEPEALYRQLGRLLESTPNFSGYDPLTTEQLTWLGRAHALVEASCDLSAAAEFKVGSGLISGALRAEAIPKIMVALYKALASAELKAPASAQGSFIPVGNSFDAFAAVGKVFQSAVRDVLVVDPYMDETVLTEFASAVPEGVCLRLLSDQSSVKASLSPAAERWFEQHGNIRPLAARLAPERTLHDRAVLVDAKDAWILTQSLKDFAKRSPAEIVRADDTAALKIAAYEAIWQNASIIV